MGAVASDRVTVAHRSLRLVRLRGRAPRIALLALTGVLCLVGLREIVLPEPTPPAPPVPRVPLRRAPGGALSVAGYPSFVGPPATATGAELPEGEEVEDPALRAGSAQVTPRSSETPSQRRGERLSATLSDSPAPRSSTTYRHRYFVVGHIVTAAVALPVFILVFRALLENGWWVQAGIYLAAVGLAVWFYLEGRRGIRVSSEGITVIETSYKTEASWGEVKTFVLFEGENGHSPQVYVRLANGRMLRLTGVDGGDFGRWDSTFAERLVGVLNSRLGEARVRASAARSSTA